MTKIFFVALLLNSPTNWNDHPQPSSNFTNSYTSEILP